MKTKVVFRKYPDGEIIALFPELDEPGLMCSCYTALGQHSSADYTGTVEKTTPASDDEYWQLKTELEELGYDLYVVRKFVRSK